MFGLGKILSLPVKLINTPLRAVEKLAATSMGENDIPKSERIISKPLEILSEAIEEIDDEE